jgi:hypothetical protein
METRLKLGVPEDLARALLANPLEFPNFMGGVVEVHSKGNDLYQVDTEFGGYRDRWSIEVSERSAHCFRWTNRGKGRFMGEILLRSIGDETEIFYSVDYEPRNAREGTGSARTMYTWDVGGDMLRFKIHIEGVLEDSLVGTPV